MKPLCAITTLEKLSDEMNSMPVNPHRSTIITGVTMAISALRLEGFVKYNEDELAITPVQLELPLDYGTLRSN